MTDSDKPKFSRKQAEEQILYDMRKILDKVEIRKPSRHLQKEPANTHSDDVPISKQHVMSVISRFTSLKNETKQ